nr:MAG TPA: hypothetical protein [Caudoviricetes sp.]
MIQVLKGAGDNLFRTRKKPRNLNSDLSLSYYC